MTPRNNRAVRPGSRKYAPPLTSAHHFRSVADLEARRQGLEAFELRADMRDVQRAWSAAYTQALFVDSRDAKSCQMLRYELNKLVGAALVAMMALPAE